MTLGLYDDAVFLHNIIITYSKMEKVEMTLGLFDDAVFLRNIIKFLT